MRSESIPFWTEERSLVLTKMLGRAIERSPGQTRRSRLAPSVMQLVPVEMVKLLYQVRVSEGSVPGTPCRWTSELPCLGSIVPS